MLLCLPEVKKDSLVYLFLADDLRFDTVVEAELIVMELDDVIPGVAKTVFCF